jgi:tetratricopeptide (TPR) repeat protein
MDLYLRRGELIPPAQISDLEEMNQILFSDLKNQNKELKKVKYYLLNGDIRMAHAHLMKLTLTKTNLRPVIFRYLAVLSFIEGSFEKTSEYLAMPELQKIPHYGKVCLVKVLTDIALSKMNELEGEWERCKASNERYFKQENIIWIETLVQLKLNPKKGITDIPFKKNNLELLAPEETKIFLKLALYLNQEKLIAEQIPLMDVDQLKDTEIRELAGLILFRTGALAKSYKFIEDSRSPNAENIKGNLYLLRNKYEVAYAQFKVALDIKQNSQNAMERLLPLAWLLGDWEGGKKYSEMVTASPQTQINKLTLSAAFLMQKGEFEKASDLLKRISNNSSKGSEIELTQISSFSALMLNRPGVVKKEALLSCQQYDIVNCWILYQMSQWDSFPMALRREDTLPEKREWEKLTSEEINSPIKEATYINQMDIEELDDTLIQLIPSK